MSEPPQVDPEPYLLGLEFKERRKELRYLHRAYCDNDERLVAAVVVDGRQRFLWVIGGRIASHPSIVREIEELIDWAREDGDEAAIGRLEKSLGLYRRERRPAIEPTAAYPLEKIDERKGCVAACPKCGRQYRALWSDADTLTIEPL